MKRASRFLLTCTLFLAMTFVVCRSASALSIGEIFAKPDEYYGKTVTISGKVVETWLVEPRHFGVKDDTGKIRVKTAQQQMPAILSTVEVTGTIVPELARDGKKYPAMKEETRK